MVGLRFNRNLKNRNIKLGDKFWVKDGNVNEKKYKGRVLSR